MFVGYILSNHLFAAILRSTGCLNKKHPPEEVAREKINKEKEDNFLRFLKIFKVQKVTLIGLADKFKARTFAL